MPAVTSEQAVEKVKKKRPNLEAIKTSPLKIRLGNEALNLIIKFIYKESTLRTRKSLNNINRLFNSIDTTIYDGKEVDILNKIWIVRTSLKAILKEEVTSPATIAMYCKDDQMCDVRKEATLAKILEDKPISYAESKLILKQVEDQLNFGYAIALKEVFDELLNSIDPFDIRSYKSVMDDLYAISSALVNMKRRNASVGTDKEFSLQEDVFQTVLTDALAVLKNRNRIFLTGIRNLNTILAPGYMGGRLYTYLAFPGGGKSQILLKAAYDIKLFNPDLKALDSDKRPAVLYITMENNLEETIERIFNMLASDDDIRNYTPKQIMNMIKAAGGLCLKDKEGTDIIVKYYKNRSIDTNDLYGIIQELADDGIEVVALILDYIKRIKPAERGQNEKEELKNISNELKDLALIFNIPVITAQQLNRVSSSVVDAALQANKQDVTRLIGKDGVAGAWELVENSDVVIVINREKKVDTGDVYLTFKLLKRRYASHESDTRLRELEYFNHPYAKGSSIRLVDDLELEESVSLISLSEQFVAADVIGSRGRKNATERKNKTSDGGDDDLLASPMEFEPFEFAV